MNIGLVLKTFPNYFHKQSSNFVSTCQILKENQDTPSIVCEISSVWLQCEVPGNQPTNPGVSLPDNINKTFCPCPDVKQLQQELDDLQTKHDDLQIEQDDLQQELENLKTQCNQESERLKNTSCEDVWKSGETSDGVYTIYPFSNRSKSLNVFCDLNTDDKPGWIVFQKRTDGSEEFYRYWNDYVNGFGDKNNEYWLGLENLHQLLSQGEFELRVDMSDFEGQSRYAKYSSFRVDGGSGYRMNVSGYYGNAGDSLTYHNGMKFSTRDKEQDEASNGDCAEKYKGAWWYKGCHQTNPNGLYLSGPHDSYADGVVWKTWLGHHYSVKSIEFKVRQKY